MVCQAPQDGQPDRNPRGERKHMEKREKAKRFINRICWTEGNKIPDFYVIVFPWIAQIALLKNCTFAVSLGFRWRERRSARSLQQSFTV